MENQSSTPSMQFLLLEQVQFLKVNDDSLLQWELVDVIDAEEEEEERGDGDCSSNSIVNDEEFGSWDSPVSSPPNDAPIEGIRHLLLHLDAGHVEEHHHLHDDGDGHEEQVDDDDDDDDGCDLDDELVPWDVGNKLGAAAATATRMNENECGEEEKEERKGSDEMSPWEQHSSVISLPRFDYNAPSSLLLHSHSGFLITCTIKREKSATKEAISILHKFVGVGSDCSNNRKQNTDTTSKRRRICTQDNAEECLGTEETQSATANSAHGKASSPAKAEADKDAVTGLSLVKLTRNGLLLFTFPINTFPDTVDIVSNIIQALESGRLSLPVWCHRIFPIQATCGLNEKELQEVVSMLVKKFVDAKQDKLERPLKFAVGYNRRGIEETKFVKENLKGPNSLLDRNKCFAIVASAVNHVVEDSVVDLRSPELCVLVELLPLSGVPNGSMVVAVSVLPRNLVSTKPRLCVKALTSNTKEGSVVQ